MINFEGQNAQEFYVRFNSVVSCKEYLSEIKWKDGFKCVKCSHSGCQIRANYDRTCNKCSHTESPSANTLFHKVKFGLDKAFIICFEMSTTTRSLSASYLAKRVGVTPYTARMFMYKVREAMKSSEHFPMKNRVEVDEFVVGGKEDGKVGRSYDSKKKKAIVALELTDDGKVKRMYVRQIKDFSAKELRPIFENHISKTAHITTDLWRGYSPIAKEYTIEQIPSDTGKNFKILHTMIHQVKSWIRTTYSYVSSFHINGYFDEFCYRLNRSKSKKTIFHNLISRMMKSTKLEHNKLVCS
jgi:hypothetical protein